MECSRLRLQVGKSSRHILFGGIISILSISRKSSHYFPFGILRLMILVQLILVQLILVQQTAVYAMEMGIASIHHDS